MLPACSRLTRSPSSSVSVAAPAEASDSDFTTFSSVDPTSTAPVPRRRSIAVALRTL
jgi:hypothetical protein